jgi:hypothetical protein
MISLISSLKQLQFMDIWVDIEGELLNSTFTDADIFAAVFEFLPVHQRDPSSKQLSGQTCPFATSQFLRSRHIYHGAPPTVLFSKTLVIPTSSSATTAM